MTNKEILEKIAALEEKLLKQTSSEEFEATNRALNNLRVKYLTAGQACKGQKIYGIKTVQPMNHFTKR